MKLLLSLCAFLTALAPLRAEEAAVVKQAELLRSVSATALDEKGFSKGQVTLKKGETYEVVSESISDVTVKNDATLIKIPKDAVKVTETQAGDAAFGASPLRIISAKLGFPKDRQYEVKEEVKKVIKDRLERGPITAAQPVEIPVSRELLRIKARFLNETYTAPDGTIRQVQKGPLFLTITYEFEGARQEKQAMEGSRISLP